MEDIPNIRFKGFADAWEQRKLGELGEIMTGSTPSTQHQEYYSDDGIPWVTPTDIVSNLIKDTPRRLSPKGEAVSRVVPANTILVTCIASIGKNALLQVKGSFNQQINGLSPYSDYDPYFLLTESELWSAKMKRQAAAATMQIVNKTDFSELETMIPFKAEQQQIGIFFRRLDHLIILHQRKCDEIIELKKYMLQKMFPQNSQKVPELRFVGFTGDWERRKFSNIVIEKLTNGIMNQQSDSQTDVKHINVINMYVSDKIHVEDLTYSSCDNIAVEKCNVEVGDIFLTRSSLKPEGIAEPNVLLDDGCFVFDDHLIRMKVNKEKYDPLFTKILLSTKPVKKQFIAKSKQNAFTTIGQEDIAESEGLFPSLSEQQEIGKYFSIIDNLITLHQHKCDALKEIKKFMLQNMFPQKG